MDMKKIAMIIVAMALYALPTTAQDWKSTSTLRGAGSNLTPQVTAVGAYSVGEMATTTASGPRKAKQEDAESLWGGQTVGETVSDPTQPGSPLGDAVLPLMLCAGAYLIIRARRRMVRSRMSEKGMEK